MLRLIDKQVDNGWQRLPMKDLAVGDVFRMYEPDGTTLVGGMWSVTEIPVERDGVWGIEAEEVELQ